MQINAIDMMKDRDGIVSLKGLIANINLAIKQGHSPVFTLTQPTCLVGSNRKGAKSSFTLDVGAGLRCSLVAAEKDVMTDSYKVLCLFAPTDLTVARDYAHFSLPLSEALTMIPCFGDWVGNFDGASDKVPAPKKRTPKVEEEIYNPTAGAW